MCRPDLRGDWGELSAVGEIYVRMTHKQLERIGGENGICGEKKMGIFWTSLYIYKIFCEGRYDHNRRRAAQNGGK